MPKKGVHGHENELLCKCIFFSDKERVTL